MNKRNDHTLRFLTSSEREQLKEEMENDVDAIIDEVDSMILNLDQNEDFQGMSDVERFQAFSTACGELLEAILEDLPIVFRAHDTAKTPDDGEVPIPKFGQSMFIVIKHLVGLRNLYSYAAEQEQV